MAEKYTGYALRFISGKYQGNEYPLPANKEVIVGRGSELDIVLVEDMISRRHAKVVTGEDYVILQDLGSTNGSFVNGERVRKQRLHEGDRILLGTSILKLVPYKGDPLQPVAAVDSAPPTDVGVEERKPLQIGPASNPGGEGLSVAPSQQQQATMHLQAFQAPAPGADPVAPAAPSSSPFGSSPIAPAASPAASPAAVPTGPSSVVLPEASQESANRSAPDLGPPSMTGSLSETPLADLLDLFSTSRKNGVLVIKNMKEGRLHFRDGVVIYAIVDNNVTVPPLKAAFRILGWSVGSFQLHPPHDAEIQQPIRENAVELMQQAQYQHEQIKRYINDLPSPIHNISLQRPLRAPLRDLRPEYLDSLQNIYNYGILDTILNKSPNTDLETYKHIAFLYKQGYIQVH
ncbi:MAG: FHA domain-containing protein [Deltaproteobacteria bacterium]|nr:MAG: FHA domain-containing protein [Deltaproteobacteria bacterium]